MTPEKTTPQPAPQVRSELTDIRFIIASALGLIAIFLLICSVFANGPEEMAKTGGSNANLWSGVGLLAVAVVMGIWWKINPTGGASGGE